MKYVNSGEGKVPLISLIAILAISLTINMPGLAVSPMLGKLKHIFGSSELEVQLLTSLPNLVMFPFVILAGKWATPKHSTFVLVTGLLIFFISGVVSLFADSMWMLIAMGCLGGIGCALVVPIAAGYISEWFAGSPRQRDLGLKSTTSNFMVIVANLYVGWIVIRNWHAAFLVYLVPIIPLLLVPFMTQKYINKHRILAAPAPVADDKQQSDGYHFQGKASTRSLVMLMALYIIFTWATMAISYYAPFTMDKYGMDSSEVGIVTAAFYATVSFGGTMVPWFRHRLGKALVCFCIALSTIGLLAIGFSHNFWIYVVAALMTGLGYGVIQPLIYNKTTYIAPTKEKAMQFFGYVLSANYIAITIVPFIDSGVKSLFHSSYPGFEFIFSGLIGVALFIWAIIERKNYVFSVNPDSEGPTKEQVEA